MRVDIVRSKRDAPATLFLLAGPVPVIQMPSLYLGSLRERRGAFNVSIIIDLNGVSRRMDV